MSEDRHKRLARILGLIYHDDEEEGEEEVSEEREEVEREYIKLEELSTPAQAKIGDITLIIREVHKLNFPFGTQYIVTCQIQDGNWLSHSFQLYVKDANELREQVKTEVQRYLIHKTELGEEVARRV